MERAFYSETISTFLSEKKSSILGKLVKNSGGLLDQVHAWQEQILLLKSVLLPYSGRIIFEYNIPRMGRRIDVVLLTNYE